jgi:putative transposase
MPDHPGHFHRHRFPADVIPHAVWLCDRFLLGHRDREEPLSEELLAERGIQVSYESVRRWANKFAAFAATSCLPPYSATS